MKLKFSTFGESHGTAIGCLLDGVPAGLNIDEEYFRVNLIVVNLEKVSLKLREKRLIK